MHHLPQEAAPGGEPSAKTALLEGMVDARDRRMDLGTAEARKDRHDLVAEAKPQGGVDVMVPLFPESQLSMVGVVDNGDEATKPVPTFGMKEAQPQPVGR